MADKYRVLASTGNATRVLSFARRSFVRSLIRNKCSLSRAQRVLCLPAGRPWLTGAQEDLRNGSLAERRSPFANTVTAVTVRWQIPTLLRALPHPRCPNFQRIKRFVNDSASAVAIPLALSLPLTTFEARADDKKR